jgi:transposase
LGSSACGRSRPQKETHTEALARSRGGFSSKLHLAVDAQGQPLELCLGPGEEHDVTCAEELLAEHQPNAVIEDKGYDTNELVQRICQRGAQAAIPPRRNRKLSKCPYKSRSFVEQFVNQIKHDCRVATRYEKTACNYLTFVRLASFLVTMGVTVNTDWSNRERWQIWSSTRVVRPVQVGLVQGLGCSDRLHLILELSLR